MRLDRYLSTNSIYSRSDIAKLVRSARITVNSELARGVGQKIRPQLDHICIDGAHVAELFDVYLMMNKPQGFVSANTDSGQPTAIDLIREKFVSSYSALLLSRLQIVGRLDKDTTGLLLLTTNGDWNHRITAPSSQCAKRYLVTTDCVISNETITAFTRGIVLKNETKPTKPAELELIHEHCGIVTIEEGKYHQVKRMFAACGNHVEALHRLSIGGIALDYSLKQGEYRHLTTTEIDSVESATKRQA